MSITTLTVLIKIGGAILIGVPLFIGLLGLIHAIRDSVARRRMPPVILIVLAGLSLVIFAVYSYCSIRYNGSGQNIIAMIGHLGWFRIEIILLITGTVCGLAGFGTYIFFSFHTDAENARDTQDVGTEHKDRRDEGSIEEKTNRPAFVNRALTVVVGAILLLVVTFIVFIKINGLVEHDLSTYKSPDGQYTIIVDNQRAVLGDQEYFTGEVYLRMSPFFVRRLEESEGRHVHMEFDPAGIQWYDDTVLIPYGSTFLTYYLGNGE